MEHVTDSLFLLVKSLSKAEKRHFSISTGKQEAKDKGFLVLFDILNEMNFFDKEALDKKIKKRNLSTDILKTRQYLFDAIVKSLIFFYSENDEEFKTRLQLMQLLVLNKKKLFGLSHKKLKIFERNCSREHRTFLLAETYALMKTNAFNLFLNNYNDDTLDDLLKKEDENLQLLMNESRYRSLLIETMKLIKMEGREHADMITRAYRKLESHPLLQDPGEAKSLRSKLIYMSVMSIVKYKLDKYEEALKYAGDYLSRIEKNQRLLHRNTFFYIVGLRNKIMALRKLGRYREVRDALLKLKTIECNNDDQEVLRFRTYYINELAVLIDAGEYEKALQLVPEVENGLEAYQGKIEKSTALEMQLLLAKVFFGKRSFDPSIRMLNIILSETNIKEYVSVCIPAKMLLMANHHELGNAALKPALARSILRQMKMEGFENSIEFAFVKIFRDEATDISSCSELLNRMNETRDDSCREPFFDFTYIRNYLQAKNLRVIDQKTTTKQISLSVNR